MRIGVLVFPDVEELDFLGPWEMLGMWSREPGGPAQRLIVAQALAPVACAKGLSLNPHVSFADCPELDVLLVPGGQGTRREVDNPVLVAFLRERGARCRSLLSVCTGAFLLHRAGLLQGRRATTHWASLDRLRALGDVQVVEQRHVRDGNLWCAAGVSAGIDMTLAFIADTAGADTAGRVQLAAEYYPAAPVYGDPRQVPGAPRYIEGGA
jgi:transcriptional regulator GlxA family with amidase domain